VRKKAIYSILIILGLIGIWQFWPRKQSETVLEIEKTELILDLIDEKICQDAILDRSWIISIPKHIEAGETARIEMAQKGNSTDVPEDTTIEICPIAIEARIDISPGVLLPGEKIIEKLNLLTGNNFSWYYTPVNYGIINGTLWVSLFEIEENENDREAPIFAFPFQIEQRTVFGLKPSFVRVLLFIICVAALFILPLFSMGKRQ
jgi:hypothetical protein